MNLVPDPDLLSADAPTGALARGLHVLSALNDLDNATISTLVSDTKLPKATVIRLLQTLVQEGYVIQELDPPAYRVSPKAAALSRALRGVDELENQIQRTLDKLADAVKWPVEYLVPDGNAMLILTNNREKSPIKVNRFERRRFPMLESAAGIVHLASLADGDRDLQLTRLTRSASQRATALEQIDAARQTGFATRDLPELAADMQVAAFPVPGHGGALSVIYFTDMANEDVLLELIAPQLKMAAKEIADVITGSDRPG